MIAIEITNNIIFLSRYEHDKHESNIDIQNYCFPLPDRREETNFFIVSLFMWSITNICGNI